MTPENEDVKTTDEVDGEDISAGEAMAEVLKKLGQVRMTFPQLPSGKKVGAGYTRKWVVSKRRKKWPGK